jgi:hypothetical protein
MKKEKLKMAEMSLKDASKLVPTDKFTLAAEQFEKVRFLYASFDDVKVDIAHLAKFKGIFNNEVKEFDKWVKCNRTFDDTEKDTCLFCDYSLKFERKLFLHVYNISLGAAQIWIAPYTVGAILQSATRNAVGQLCQNIYEIGRTGEKLQTKYSIQPVCSKEDGRLVFDQKTMDKLPAPLNKYQQKFISVKTPEEINKYFQVGYFEYVKQENEEDENTTQQRTTSQPVSRRNVPANQGLDSGF